MADGSEEWIVATQETLGKLISRPKMTDKYLKKPPFRFLHDIVMEVSKASGFGNGLFTDEEKDAANLSDKSAKVDFLNKAISVTCFALGEKIDVSANKIVAGLEADKTNAWLQRLHAAATTAVDKSDEAVQRVLSGESSAAPKKKKKEEEAPAAPPQEGGDAAAADAAADEEAKKRERRKKREEEKRRAAEEAAAAEGGAAPEAPPPPADDGADAAAKEEEKRKKEEERRKREERKRQKAEEEERQRQAQEEAERQQQALLQQQQAEAEAQAQQQAYLQQQQQQAAEEEQRRMMMVQQQQQQIPDDGAMENIGSAPGSAQAQQRPMQDPYGQGAPDLATQEAMMQQAQQAEDPMQQKMERPRTAGRKPPKVTSKVKQTQDEPGLAQGVAAPVIIGEGNDDKDDDDMFEAPVQQGLNMPVKADANQPHGKLVADLLAEKKAEEDKERLRQEEEATREEVEEPGQKGIKMGKLKRKGQDRTSASEIDTAKLSESIQQLCQAANPLGKSIDLVHQDISHMGKELDQWKNEYRDATDQYQSELKMTEELLQPLYQKIAELDDRIIEQKTKIRNSRSRISKNDLKIQSLLESVVMAK